VLPASLRRRSPIGPALTSWVLGCVRAVALLAAAALLVPAAPAQGQAGQGQAGPGQPEEGQPAAAAPAQDEPTDDGTGEGPDFSVLQEGPPIVVGIDVEGLRLNDPERIAARLGLRVGEPLPTRGVFRQREGALYDDFKIVVAPNGYALEEVEGGVIAHLVLVEFPYDLDPQFVGNTKFDVDRLREWANIGDRAQVYTAEAPAIADRITRAYRRQGYHFVEVQTRIRAEDFENQEIVFEIREGPKVYVKAVRIEGNESYPDEGVLFWRTNLKSEAKLRTKGRGLFAWYGHRYDTDVLDADCIAIAQAYRDRGHLDVVVDYRTEFTRDRSGAYVTFIVDEGPRYSVGSVEVRAYEIEPDPANPREDIERRVDLVIPEEELSRDFSLVVGEPYEIVRLLNDRRTLLDIYGERGHIDAGSFEDPDETGTAGWRWLTPEVVVDYENKQVFVVYRIQQGRPFTLRMNEINGNLSTMDHVIRSKIAQLPGERIDAARIRADRARIERTGYFSDPNSRGLHPPPSITFRTVPGEPDLVDMVVRVEEGRTIVANLSGGVASDQGLVGIVSLTINNFDPSRHPDSFWGVFGEVYRKNAYTGAGHTLGIDVSPGSEVNYSRLFYQNPDVFSRYFDPIGFLAEGQIRDRLFRSNDERRSFVRAAITRAFGQGDLRTSLGFRVQSIDIDDLDDDVPRTLTNSEGQERFVGLEGSISYTTLDNPRLPRTGFATRLSNTLYLEEFGSDRNLWKTELSFDRYFHLSRDEFDAAPGIYVGLGAGLNVPIDGQKGSVNYGERFFFGGARIGRGFRFRGIGPYEGDFPLGGETFARATLEYRVPLYTQTVPGTDRRREVFRGSLFMDAVTLGPEAYDLDLDETRVSAGIALGLIDPFPVTFSFGWPLRSEESDERQVFAFSLTLR